MDTAPMERRASLPGGGLTLAAWKELSDPSELSLAQDQYHQWAEGLARKLEQRALESHNPELHPTATVENMTSGVNRLQGCIFVGHTNTDCDSVASAVGAAYLFEGRAARSEVTVNGEIEFMTQYAGYKDWVEVSGGEALPPYFSDIPGAADPNNSDVGLCMVDCNAPEQMVRDVGPIAFPAILPAEQQKSVDVRASAGMRSRLRGVIDHHALSEHIATAGPIFLDVRPWGSACSIVTHMFIRHGCTIPVVVARLLLCGILSDTVNLTSPTTTEADRMMSTLLVFFADEPHVNDLAQRMFRAKTAYLTALPPFDMVRADQKTFTFAGLRVSFSALEVNEPDKVMAQAAGIITELRLLKKDKGLDFALLAVVDLVNHRSDLIICGAQELALAVQAYDGPLSAAVSSLSEAEDCFRVPHLLRQASVQFSTDNNSSLPAPPPPPSGCCDGAHHHHQGDGVGSGAGPSSLSGEFYSAAKSKMDLGGRVSRKLDFIPPIASLLTTGWKPEAAVAEEAKCELAPDVATSHVCGEAGCALQREYSFDQVLAMPPAAASFDSAKSS